MGGEQTQKTQQKTQNKPKKKHHTKKPQITNQQNIYFQHFNCNLEVGLGEEINKKGQSLVLENAVSVTIVGSH